MGAAEPEVSVENFLVVPGVDKPPKKRVCWKLPVTQHFTCMQLSLHFKKVLTEKMTMISQTVKCFLLHLLLKHLQLVK